MTEMLLQRTEKEKLYWPWGTHDIFHNGFPARPTVAHRHSENVKLLPNTSAIPLVDPLRKINSKREKCKRPTLNIVEGQSVAESDDAAFDTKHSRRKKRATNKVLSGAVVP